MRTVIRNSYTPQTGDYCNKIVVDQDKGVQYIFDSDGVWSTYTSKQQEGAPLFYVDSTVNAAKSELKTYADTKDAQTLASAKAYADTQDAQVLADAKAYTDAHGGGSAEAAFIDLTVTGYEAQANGVIRIDATASKTLAEAKALWEAGAIVIYRLVLSTSPVPGSIYTGTYEIQPLYIGTNAAVGSYMDAANDMNMAMTQLSSGVTILYYSFDQVVENAGFVKASDLSTVATSGSYDDLTGTPMIPTVNNATLTIQKNGSNVATFTANASSNATANITVPTINLSTTDPGEGSTLAANTFIGVYS